MFILWHCGWIFEILINRIIVVNVEIVKLEIERRVLFWVVGLKCCGLHAV